MAACLEIPDKLLTPTQAYLHPTQRAHTPHTPTNTPRYPGLAHWTDIIVSALGSRVGRTPARSNEQTNDSETSQLELADAAYPEQQTTQAGQQCALDMREIHWPCHVLFAVQTNTCVQQAQKRQNAAENQNKKQNT